jgi:hypothetical protein
LAGGAEPDLEDALKKLDRLTQEEARIAFAEVLRAHNIRDDVKVVDGRVERVEDVNQKVEGVQHDDVKVDSETVDDTVHRRSVDSKEQGSPPLTSLPIPPPTALGEHLDSFGLRRRRPVRDAATKTTQPIIPIERAAPQSTTGARASLPAASLGGAAAPATSAPSPFSFTTLTPSRPPAFPAGVGDRNSDGDGAIAPSSTWWNNLKRNRTNPIEQAEGYAYIRSVRPFLFAGPTQVDTPTL